MSMKIQINVCGNFILLVWFTLYCTGLVVAALDFFSLSNITL